MQKKHRNQTVKLSTQSFALSDFFYLRQCGAFLSSSLVCLSISRSSQQVWFSG